jgi:hypothetical protein
VTVFRFPHRDLTRLDRMVSAVSPELGLVDS